MLPTAFHPIFAHPLPEGHRFPMLKYDLLPKQLLYEGTATISDFFEPEIINLDYVLAVHGEKYVDDLINLKLYQL
jgi:acetoin utilization deacetylase AcuC-like enzyme